MSPNKSENEPINRKGQAIITAPKDSESNLDSAPKRNNRFPHSFLFNI